MKIYKPRIRAYLPSELAKLYGLSTSSLRRMLIEAGLGEVLKNKKFRKYFTPLEVKKIFNTLGEVELDENEAKLYFKDAILIKDIKTL